MSKVHYQRWDWAMTQCGLDNEFINLRDKSIKLRREEELQISIVMDDTVTCGRCLRQYRGGNDHNAYAQMVAECS